jgi:hypothetical protein
MNQMTEKFKNILILLIFAGVGYLFSKPAMPLISKFFIPFPTLEDTILYEGTVEVIGEDCFVGGCPPLRYYVTDASGSHEIYWGLPGDRYGDWYSKVVIDGATGKFWFDPTFGVIQEDFVIHTNIPQAKEKYDGKRIFHGIAESLGTIRLQFNWTKHLFKGLLFIAYLIFYARLAYKLFNDKTNAL